MNLEQKPSFTHSRNLSVRSRRAITARRDEFLNFRAKFEEQKKLTDKLKNWQSFIQLSDGLFQKSVIETTQ